MKGLIIVKEKYESMKIEVISFDQSVETTVDIPPNGTTQGFLLESANTGTVTLVPGQSAMG